MQFRALTPVILLGLFAAAQTTSACDASPAQGGTATREAPRAAELRSATVRAAIDAAARVLRTRGYSPTREERRGFVVERTALIDELPMRTGSCYVAIGAGSAALTSLELALHDSDGAAVAHGAAPATSRAALQFCPPHSGTYYLAARAASGDGIVALRIFEGPSGLDVRVDDLFAPPEPPAGPTP